MKAKINWEFVREFAEAPRFAEGEDDPQCCHGFDHWGKCSICNRSGMECTPMMPNVIPTFEEAWAVKKAEGYQYGEDALEQVRFGWELRESYMRR